MLKGKTDTGFVFKIEDEALDDMEILESLTDMQNGQLGAISHVLVALLGEEQKKKLYDHCRAKSGRVPVTAVTKELEDIFKKASENKDVKN